MREGEDEVWLVVYSHKHGKDYSVCGSLEVADTLVLALARENFSDLKDSASKESRDIIWLAIEEEDADDVYSHWDDFSGMLEYFERIGPMKVLES